MVDVFVEGLSSIARYIIPGLLVEAVVHEPFGAHPSYAQGYYDRDNQFYLEWLFLIPLFWAMRGVTPKRAFFLGWILGTVGHSGVLPGERGLADLVWIEVDRQIGNYVRGKFWEIIIVWAASLLAFSFFGLQYAMLLAVLVGLSVVVPYVGATVVTFPVLLVAWFQWGWSSDFIYLGITYLVIQAIDGNVLVPLLFSEVVNLHPVAIIVAILVFGGLWGFWGVFFAIPLGTLVKAVLTAWPRAQKREQREALQES